MRQMFHLFRNKTQQQLGEFSRGEMFVLNYLAFTDEKMLAGELSAAMDASTARIAAVLKTLEEKNLILREKDSCDKRRVLVSITTAGRHYIETQKSLLQIEIERMLHSLGETDAAELIRLVTRITAISTGKQGNLHKSSG